MSHYETLGVPRDADRDTIKKAHRRMARKYHPDVSNEENAKEKFQAIQRAYEVLEDPERRAHYDETGRDEVSDPEAEARDLLATVMKQTLMRAIDVPHVNLMRVAGLVLDEMQDTINKQLHQCQNILKKMEKHKGRVRTKAPLNMYEAVLQSEKERVEAMIANHPKVLDSIKRVRKMLKEYESEDLQEVQTRSIFAQAFWGRDND